MIYPENHDDHIKHVKNWLVSGKDHANKKTKESVSRVTNILEDILEKKEAKKQKIIFITLMLIIFVAIITIISFYGAVV